MNRILKLSILLAVLLGAMAPVVALTPQQMATMMLTGVGKPAVGGGGGTLTYTLTQAFTQSGVSTSFAGVAIGTVTSDRTIVVTAQESSNGITGCQNGGGAPPAVTIGGVAMANVTQAAESPNGSCNYVYYLFAPAGVLNATTATLSFTSVNPAGGWAFTAGTLTGSTTTSVNASNGNTWSGGGVTANPRGVTNDLAGVAVATGGVVITGWGIDRTGPYTANSTNTIVDGQGASSAGAFLAAHGTNGSPNFISAANFNGNFVIVSFKP